MTCPRQTCFLHIPKTGGSSIVAAFKNAVRPEHFYQVTTHDPRSVPLTLLLRRYPIVAGHFTFAQLQPLLGTTFTFTFVREPVDRVVSLFHFYRAYSQDVQPDPRVGLARANDFDSFVEQLPDRVSPWSNWQTFIFSGARDCELPASTMLPQALANLERVDFVGIQEDVANGIRVLNSLLALPLVPPERRLNATLERPAVGELTPQTQGRLEQLNRCDAELFHHARMRWSARRGLASEPSLPSAPTTQSSPDEHRVDSGTREIVVFDVRVEIEAGLVIIRAYSSINADDVTVGIRISDVLRVEIYGVNTRLLGTRLKVAADETFEVVFALGLHLLRGEYDLTVAIHAGDDHFERCYHWLEPALRFKCGARLQRHFSGIVDLNATSIMRGRRGVGVVTRSLDRSTGQMPPVR